MARNVTAITITKSKRPNLPLGSQTVHHVEWRGLDRPHSLRARLQRLSQTTSSILHSLLIASVGAMTGCSGLAGPEYQRPDMPDKQAWSQLAQVSAADVIRPDWWTGFKDGYLNELVSRAIAGNFDLQALATRIDQAEAGIGADRARLLPTLSHAASATAQGEIGASNSMQYAQSFSLSWEIDIWGKTRKAVKAREAEYKASEADWRAGYLLLVSDVANAYFEIRRSDEEITTQKESLETSKRILGIYEAQFREGLVPESQLMSQRAEVKSLERSLVDLERQRAVRELSLSTLLGIPAGEFKVPAGTLTNTVMPMAVPAGLPSDLLSRRPDILAQEYRVLSAHELLGSARLARLPTLVLTGNTGSTSNILSQALKTWSYGVGPTISFPIFDPNISASIKSSEASAKSAEAQYRSTVIRAFEEVEAALTNIDSRKRQLQLIEEQIKQLEGNREVQHTRLREGLATWLEVFETERTLLNARQNRLQTYQTILTDTVLLYKALGGGWPAEHVGVTSESAFNN